MTCEIWTHIVLKLGVANYSHGAHSEVLEKAKHGDDVTDLIDVNKK